MKQKRISRNEALKLLGCTERQLQRLAAKGKLTVEYVQEGNARRATYVEAEVVALKQAQEAPEIRGIVVRPAETENQKMEGKNQDSTLNTQHSALRNPLTLPPQAMQVLQMLGATANVEAGKCVSVEEIKFDKMTVGADGSTRMSGVSVSRYSAQA